MFTQLARNAACNHAHNTRQRCARWLLMSADRMHADSFDLTHEFLAQMLAVRRASVSEVASALADDGCIRYSRGRITLLDRDRLEANACDCYHVIRDTPLPTPTADCGQTGKSGRTRVYRPKSCGRPPAPVSGKRVVRSGPRPQRWARLGEVRWPMAAKLFTARGIGTDGSAWNEMVHAAGRSGSPPVAYLVARHPPPQRQQRRMAAGSEFGADCFGGA